MFKSIKEFGIAKSIVATITGAYIGIAALNYATAPEPCYGVCASDYNAVLSSKGFVQMQPKEKLNNVYLIDYNTPFTLGSSEVFANKLDRILSTANRNDILFIRLTSGGGATVSCSHSYQQIQKAKHYGLKVVTSIDYLAASCGYMLASASDVIVASPGAQVGNIGAVMTYQDGPMDILRKFVQGKKELFGSTRIKELMAGAEPVNGGDYKILRDIAIENAKQFNNKVIKSRGNKLDIKEFNEIFSAKLFSAEKALELGLIDELGDQRTNLQLLHLKGHKIIMVNYIIKTKAPIAEFLGL